MIKSLIIFVGLTLGLSSCVSLAQRDESSNSNVSSSTAQTNSTGQRDPTNSNKAIPSSSEVEPSIDELENLIPEELGLQLRCNIEEGVDIAPDGEGSAPFSVTFDASDSEAPCGKIVKWVWSFGDDGIGKGRIVTHTYRSPGEYAVTLKLTDDKGHHNLLNIAYMVKVTGDTAIPPDRRLPSKAKAGNPARQRRALQDSTNRNTK